MNVVFGLAVIESALYGRSCLEFATFMTAFTIGGIVIIINSISDSASGLWIFHLVVVVGVGKRVTDS